MGNPIYRKLIITAFVTSIAFGGFSALNFFIFRQLNPTPPKVAHGRIHLTRQDDHHFRKSNHPQVIQGPAKMRGTEKDRSLLLNNSLLTSGGMLITWLLNIGLFLLMEKRIINKKWRTPIRYIVSYAVVMLLIIACIHLGFFNSMIPKFPGTIIPGPGNNSFIISGDRPVPSFGFRFERSQLPFMTAIVINTIVMVILELILVLHHKGQVELENTRLRMNHLLAKHQHLKHQLQPHFLFNSLSTLKSLIKVSPATAEVYLVQLSVLLRSSLASHELTVVPLAEELQLCRDYLELQKMRYGNAFHFVIQIPEAVTATISVPAFSLQVLVENAIKHNVLTVENPLTIYISYQEEGYIEVKNNKRIKSISEPHSGTGLANLSERYKLISGHDILIIVNENDFIVKIKTLKK